MEKELRSLVRPVGRITQKGIEAARATREQLFAPGALRRAMRIAEHNMPLKSERYEDDFER